MNPKITPEHLQRLALVYVRQSSVMQTIEHTEGKRRQYALAETAAQLGFVSVETIDDDLGRSASGLVGRPGFQRLVSLVCSGTVGAVFCLEASRLARNGRDWHHLIDLCALVGALLIDPDGVYDPRLSNDRLLLGLKGTMSEYELSLLQQRGLAARECLAKRGELRFVLPPGFCWDALGRIELDPNERVREAIALVFRKFDELGTARQVWLWAKLHGIRLPVRRQGMRGAHLEWKVAAYHTIQSLLRHPMYAGAYVFGRTEKRVRVEGDRATKSAGHKKPPDRWTVLLRSHHPGYISWEDYERHQRMMAENAHMQKRASRRSARGGSALLTGLLRCGRCGRMLHVMYRTMSRRAHRYYCRGGQVRPCVGVGGIRIDRAVSEQLLAVVAPHAVEAAVEAMQRGTAAQEDVRRALIHELEEAEYEADLAARRYETVDPGQRLVARELEARWETTLARVRQIKQKLETIEAGRAAQPQVDRARLLELARDLSEVWNAPTVSMSTKHRIVRILVEEVVLDIDEKANEILLVVHWKGGRHGESRLGRGGSGGLPAERRPSAVDVLSRLGGKWTDRELGGDPESNALPSRGRCYLEGGGRA